MKTILQFAFSAFARIDLLALKRLWAVIEEVVREFEADRSKGSQLTGAQRLDYTLARARPLIPEGRRDVGTQIARAIVEIVLIGIRLGRPRVETDKRQR